MLMEITRYRGNHRLDNYSPQPKVNAPQQLQSASGEELSALIPSNLRDSSS
jgi:hypothetical protein